MPYHSSVYKYLAVLFLLALPFSGFAQLYVDSEIKLASSADSGKIILGWLTVKTFLHGSIEIEWNDIVVQKEADGRTASLLQRSFKDNHRIRSASGFRIANNSFTLLLSDLNTPIEVKGHRSPLDDSPHNWTISARVIDRHTGATIETWEPIEHATINGVELKYNLSRFNQ